MSSLAHNYFEKFSGPDAATLLASLPDSPEKEAENDWLDYKSGRVANDFLAAAGKDRKGAREKVEELWSALVAQFANNEGGVVLWGIDCRIRKNEKGNDVDEPGAVVPIQDGEAFVCLLRKLDQFVTDPPVSGVLHKVIHSSSGDFVVSYIPEGRQKPYRAEKADRRWLIRSGESKIDISPSLLRTLFYPSTHAKADVYLDQYSPFWEAHYLANVAEHPHTWVLNLGIANAGRVSLRDLHLYVSTSLGGKVYHWKEGVYDDNGLPSSLTLFPAALRLNATLHPGMTHNEKILVNAEDGTDLEVRLFSEDQPMIGGVARLHEGCSMPVAFSLIENYEVPEIDLGLE